jgi:hemolysin activation/secretion protein
VQRTVFNWRVTAEAAVSESDYGRLATTLRLTQPLTPSLTTAVEITAGVAGNGSPPQREFFLGGAGTLRGVRENSVTGPAFWMARTELGMGLPGLRAVLFTDVGWAGPRDGGAKSRPTAGAGAGASFMDGLMRVDLARAACCVPIRGVSTSTWTRLSSRSLKRDVRAVRLAVSPMLSNATGR